MTNGKNKSAFAKSYPLGKEAVIKYQDIWSCYTIKLLSYPIDGCIRVYYNRDGAYLLLIIIILYYFFYFNLI